MTDTSKSIKIKIDHIRHAYSCANSIYSKYMQQNEPIDSKMMNFLAKESANVAPDSVITNIGIRQAIKLGNKYRKRFDTADIIICSELRRCMETAVLACRNRERIYIVPYVGEIDITYDNCPIEFNEKFMMKHMYDYVDSNMTYNDAIKTRAYSKAYMKKHYNNFPIIDNTILLKFNGEKVNPFGSDHNKFYDNVLPIIIDMIKKNGKDTYEILLFTHSGHIRTHFGIDSKLGRINIKADPRYIDRLDEFIDKTNHPYNTSIYTEIIEVNNDNKITVNMANPCDCHNICTKWHQIKLSDQNITYHTNWDDLQLCDIERCLIHHKKYKKYHDEIKNEYLYHFIKSKYRVISNIQCSR